MEGSMIICGGLLAALPLLLPSVIQGRTEMGMGKGKETRRGEEGSDRIGVQREDLLALSH